MTITNDELWVLARVEADGSVGLSIADDPDDPTSSTPVAGTASLTIRSPESSVRVRLRVRSSSGDCVPKWTPSSPSSLVTIGDALSDPLPLPRDGTTKLTVSFQVSAVSASLELQMSRAPGGIDIVLRPPPVEPPVSACEPKALAVVARAMRSPDSDSTNRPWHGRAAG